MTTAPVPGRGEAAPVPSTSTAGGLLILAACLPLLGAAATAMGGGAVSVGGDGIGGTLMTIALALIAGGSTLLATSPPLELRPREARAGLALLPLGTVSTVLTANVSASSTLVLVYLGGTLLLVIGVAIIALALLRSQGHARWVGIAFGASLVMAIGAATIGSAAVDAPSSVSRTIAGALVGFAGIAVIAGVAGLGMLGVRSARTPH